jgi:hypothetical protein
MPVPEEPTPEVQEAMGVDGVPPSAASVEVDVVSSQPSDDARGSLWGLVMCSDCVGVPGSVASDHTSPAPRSSCAVGLGVSSLLPPGTPILPPSPINWRRVEGDVELACSQVADAEMLLHDTLSSIGQNILHLLWVSLKKDRKVCLCASSSFRVPSLPHVHVYIAFVPE